MNDWYHYCFECYNKKYVGVKVNDNLCFQEYVYSAIAFSSQRKYISKNFVYLSSKFIVLRLKSFILSLICCCLPVIFEYLWPSTRNLCAGFSTTQLRVGIDHSDIETLIAYWTKPSPYATFMMTIIINDFLFQHPNGRYGTVKRRAMWGRDAF